MFQQLELSLRFVRVSIPFLVCFSLFIGHLKEFTVDKIKPSFAFHLSVHNDNNDNHRPVCLQSPLDWLRERINLSTCTCPCSRSVIAQLTSSFFSQLRWWWTKLLMINTALPCNLWPSNGRVMIRQRYQNQLNPNNLQCWFPVITIIVQSVVVEERSALGLPQMDKELIHNLLICEYFSKRVTMCFLEWISSWIRNSGSSSSSSSQYISIGQ